MNLKPISMKSILLLSLLLFIGINVKAQHEVCRLPINSAWFKNEPTTGYDYVLGDARLDNFLKSVASSRYVYLYFNRNGTWQLAAQCAIPKNSVKTFYFKNGIQYGITVQKKDRPTPITLIRK